MIKEIIQALANYKGEWKQNGEVWEFVSTVAERRVFISTKKLIYSAKIKVDEVSRIINFSEMLVENSVGIDAGLSIKTETYNTLNGSLQGTIEEQSSLFGKKYQYKFNYQEIRNLIEDLSKSLGYKFEYQVFPLK
ncbi:MAG: hypothetical protein WC503_03340 [Candidatus Shapirobacteria bacterium]